MLIVNVYLKAQENKDEMIFRAMQDEMDRGMKELKQSNCEPICYSSVDVVYGQSFMIRGVLGGIMNSVVNPIANGVVEVLAGDYNFTSQIEFPRELGRHQFFGLPVEPEYRSIRRGIWGAMDATYKMAQKQIFRKRGYFDNVIVSDEEKKIVPFPKIEPVVKIESSEIEYKIDQAYWENYIKEITAIFQNYKEITSSGAYITGKDLDFYHLTTEGTKVKQSGRYVYFFCGVSLRDAEGVERKYQLTETVISPTDMPSLEEMKKRVTAMAETLQKIKRAQKFEGEYTGPVLYLGDVCQRFLLGGDLLGSNSNYIASRRKEDPALYMKYKETLENKIGTKVTHPALTVKNYTFMNEYSGKKLLGSYEIDAEGVIPEKEMTLIENGVLKQVLSSRTRSVHTGKTTGSMRFAMNGAPVSSVFPGTLHVSVNEGHTEVQLKKMLIKEAKKQKLKYAYIVRGQFGAYFPEIYRVDVKSGEEVLVFAAVTPRENWGFMSRAVAFSSEESVVNIPAYEYPLSLIYPNGVLIKSMQLKAEPNKVKESTLTRPMDR